MNIFAHRYLGRSRFVEGLVEEWKREHDEAMLALTVEELVEECIDLGHLSQHAWSGFRELLFKDPNASAIGEVGAVMKEALTKTLEIFETIRELSEKAKASGHAIRNATQFEAVFQETKIISETVHDLFAPPDPQVVEEAIASFKRGECIPIEELIRAAQDGRFPGD
jgi:hypothetical protein